MRPWHACRPWPTWIRWSAAPWTGGACDRLAQSSGVPIAQSGAVRTGEEITPLSTPNNALQSFEVTQGMLSLIASNGAVASPIDTSGIWVSTDVARDFGLTVGSTLATDHGNATVAGVYPWPNDGRDTRFAYAFLVPRAAALGDYNECWIRQWPRSEPASNLLYSTLRVGNGQNQAGVVALNKGFDAHYDPYATYMARTTRWIPFLAALLGLAIGVIAVRMRRLEYAAALHSGESKPAQLLGICVETLVWAGLATTGSSPPMVCAWPSGIPRWSSRPHAVPHWRCCAPWCLRRSPVACVCGSRNCSACSKAGERDIWPQTMLTGPRPVLDSELDTGADARGASAERGQASTD